MWGQHKLDLQLDCEQPASRDRSCAFLFSHPLPQTQQDLEPLQQLCSEFRSRDRDDGFSGCKKTVAPGSAQERKT